MAVPLASGCGQARDGEPTYPEALEGYKMEHQELERLERLRKSAAFSVARYQDKLRDVERFKSALAEARAQSDQAQAELRMADINLHNAKIIAPYGGVVSARMGCAWAYARASAIWRAMSTPWATGMMSPASRN